MFDLIVWFVGICLAIADVVGIVRMVRDPRWVVD